MDDEMAQMLQDVARKLDQYLQHLPMCGSAYTPDPASPGVVITHPVEGCTCGLHKIMPMWHEWLWDEVWGEW